MIFNLLLYALFAIIPLYYFKKRRLNAVKELGLERKKAQNAWKHSLIIFGAMFLASLALGLGFQAFNYSDIEKVTQALKEARTIPLLFTFSITIGVVLEEFFFRGFLIEYFDKQFRQGKKRKGKVEEFFTENCGILLSSALFATMHLLYGSIVEIAGAFALGIVLAFFFKKYKNLYANTYAHLLWNAMGLIASSIA